MSTLIIRIPQGARRLILYNSLEFNQSLAIGANLSAISLCIDVHELNRALIFYTEVLGCEVVERKEEHAKLNFQGNIIYLIQKEEGSMAVTDTEIKRSFKRHWTPVHIDFAIEDSDTAVAKVLELGGKHEGKKTGDWGRFDFCSDPSGNGFCLSNMK